MGSLFPGRRLRGLIVTLRLRMGARAQVGHVGVKRLGRSELGGGKLAANLGRHRVAIFLHRRLRTGQSAFLRRDVLRARQNRGRQRIASGGQALPIGLHRLLFAAEGVLETRLLRRVHYGDAGSNRSAAVMTMEARRLRANDGEKAGT